MKTKSKIISFFIGIFPFAAGWFAGIILQYYKPESPMISFVLLGVGLGILMGMFRIPERFFENKYDV